MITTKVPGKLYLAGEYAVLYPENPAIIFSVNRFINITIDFRDNNGRIKDNGLQPLFWTRDHISYSHKNDDYFDVLFAAIRITDQYLKQHNISLKYYDIVVETELKDSGIKIGLGSSAAICVGTIKGILSLYQIPFDCWLIYKLAVLAHLELNLVGSFGDIAACCFTGIIAYTAVNRQWLETFVKTHDLLTVITTPWPWLSIESLPIPDDFLYYKIGWTKASASTQEMVKELRRQSLSDTFITSFRQQNRYHVHQLIQSIKTKDFNTFKTHLQQVRLLLLQLQEQSGILIETDELNKLVTLAEKYGGVGKSSGAGGGDCGIAFFQKNTDLNQISKLWHQYNIQDLNLKIYQEVLNES